jgi:type II secretory pathway component GspD/PulD (secretin)
VVSNPKIIVANEETASIHIGQKKPNIKGTIQTAGDSQVTRVYALDDAEPYFEDGVRIDVTPTVNTEDNITVRIQPKLDRLDADPTMAPDGTEFWGKSTKTIETVFGLEDGQTAAIGGLTEASKSDVDRKVPLLGDLPFIGRLFSYSSKNSRQVETIIFVTVGMASPASMEFETGLPEDSTLAMRHRAEAATERAINKEEMNILQAVETERLRERIGVLREAEQKRTGNLKK